MHKGSPPDVAPSTLLCMKTTARILYPTLIITLIVFLLLGFIPSLQTITSWVTPPVALALGLVYALLFGTTHPKINRIGSKMLLQYSVVGLGFGMNIHEALKSGSDGMLFTIVSVFGTLFLGWVLGRKLFRLSSNTSRLISAGTAICGGSAIAAVAPIIKAQEDETSVALGAVFILNALALFLFPIIGHALELSQVQFGTWAAIAIHDTSSVVGAGQSYGEKALQVATTIKLTRALWIIPVTLFYSLVVSREQRTKNHTEHREKQRKLPIPLFIIFFIVAIILNTYIISPYLPEVGTWIASLAKKGLTLSLFFIGAGLTRKVIVQVGPKAFGNGVLLWILIGVGSLCFVYLGGV